MNQIGPELPPGFLNRAKSEEEASASEDEQEAISAGDEQSYGPALPPDLQESASIEYGAEVGPSMVEESEAEYEQRLQELRRQNNKPKGEKREEWMIKLPKKLQSYGLGARTFSKRGVESNDEDRSDWTDEPEEKIRKLIAEPSKKVSEKDIKSKALSERDRKYEEQTKIMNKDRNKSLLDIHSSKEAETKKVSTGERQPFNREKDMHIKNLFKNDKQELVEKAQQLGGRFSHGKQQKFL